MIEITLDRSVVWLRITRPHYTDPFDAAYAHKRGGRWNPPQSWPTLYLNRDLPTVHAQLRHLFAGRGIDPDDLSDGAPILLAAATLPARQRVADLTSAEALADVELPVTYLLDATGEEASHEVTRSIGHIVREAGLRGIFCRSAATVDGSGRELAWFPAPRARACAAWPHPLGFGRWRHARTLDDIRGVKTE